MLKVLLSITFIAFGGTTFSCFCKKRLQKKQTKEGAFASRPLFGIFPPKGVAVAS